MHICVDWSRALMTLGIPLTRFDSFESLSLSLSLSLDLDVLIRVSNPLLTFDGLPE
jgi:hypothetical protein